jgi:hypothetical protein
VVGFGSYLKSMSVLAVMVSNACEVYAETLLNSTVVDSFYMLLCTGVLLLLLVVRLQKMVLVETPSTALIDSGRADLLDETMSSAGGG